MMDTLSPIFQGESIQVETIRSLIGSHKEINEKKFKSWLKTWQESGVFENVPEEKEKAEKFITADYQYFGADTFFDNELIELNERVQGSWNEVQNYLFNSFKKVLERQIDFINSGTRTSSH